MRINNISIMTYNKRAIIKNLFTGKIIKDFGICENIQITYDTKRNTMIFRFEIEKEKYSKWYDFNLYSYSDK